MTLKYGAQFEIRKLIFTLENVKSEFYQRNDFYVLPSKTNLHRGVYLPDIDYSQIKNFRKKIPTKGTYDVSSWEVKTFTKADCTFLEKILEPNLLKPTEVENCQKVIQKINKPFTDILKTLFDIQNDKIIIVPTHIGTIASSFRIGEKIIVYWRIENDISEAIAMILEDFVTKKFEGQKFTKEQWVEKERFVDQLMTNTKLNNLFPNYLPTINPNAKDIVPNQVKFESSKYLQKLGFAIDDDLYIANDDIYINSKILETKRDYPETVNFLKILIKNKGKIVSFYDVGRALWDGDINKFSLQALAKQAQFAREILEENGISKDKIKTYRKKGYILER